MRVAAEGDAQAHSIFSAADHDRFKKALELLGTCRNSHSGTFKSLAARLAMRRVVKMHHATVRFRRKLTNRLGIAK